MYSREDMEFLVNMSVDLRTLCKIALKLVGDDTLEKGYHEKIGMVVHSIAQHDKNKGTP